ncbi:MAG: CoA transferase, partial [Hydrogenophaga sp.]|nr:CoA transferase [Hydrogenophaga sp.]
MGARARWQNAGPQRPAPADQNQRPGRGLLPLSLRMNAPARTLPLAGLRVVEFTHMVMGPTCGMVLA